MLNRLNPLAIHLYTLACLLWYSSLAEYDMCSRLFIYCIYTTLIAAQTWRLMMSTRRACHQSVACGVPFWRSAASCSLWWYVVETLGHVMLLILSFTLWHCIWYSLSHYVCVTWSWRTCNLCIRVRLQIRVWHQVSSIHSWARSLVLVILFPFASWFFGCRLFWVSSRSEIDFRYLPNTRIFACFLVLSQTI
jgi:hypothetical protein